MSHHNFEEIRQKYIETYVARDGSGLAEIFTDDCFMLPPDGPIADGRAGVQAFYEAQFEQMTPQSLTIEAKEEVVVGDWGYGAGSFSVTATLKATGETVELGGKYLNIVKLQADGSWKISRHLWNAPTQLSAMAAQGS